MLFNTLRRLSVNDPYIQGAEFKIKDDGDVFMKLLEESLRGNTYLRELKLYELSFNETGSSSLAAILRHNIQIRSLMLSKIIASSSDLVSALRHLECNNTLRKLDLIDTRLTPNDIQAMARVLLRNQFLVTLSLKGADLGPGSTHIAKAMATNSTLQILDLSDNNITAKESIEIANMLRANTKLACLNLNNNPIRPVGVIAMSLALCHNTTLSYLLLRNTGLDNQGYGALASCLQVNTAIRILDLGHNELIGAGGRSFLETLAQNTTLADLNLERVNLNSNEMISVLCTALQSNTTLKSLNLSCNGITCRAVNLTDVLKTRTTLTRLYLAGNPLGQTSIENDCRVFMRNLCDIPNLEYLNLKGCRFDFDTGPEIAHLIAANTTLQTLELKDAIGLEPYIDMIFGALIVNITLQRLGLPALDREPPIPDAMYYNTTLRLVTFDGTAHDSLSLITERNCHNEIMKTRTLVHFLLMPRTWTVTQRPRSPVC